MIKVKETMNNHHISCINQGAAWQDSQRPGRRSNVVMKVTLFQILTAFLNSTFILHVKY